MKLRLASMDAMQAIAIFLVVIAHCGISDAPGWYWSFRNRVYTFHMALFIFISGFLISYNYVPIHDFSQYGRYVGKRLKKFFIPFVLAGLLCLGLAAVESGGGREFWRNGLLLLFLAPRASHSGFLWYIYLLSFLYCIVPFLFRISFRLRSVLLLLSIVPACYPLSTNYFCLNSFCRLFFFFLSGVIVAEKWGVLCEKFSIYGWGAIFLWLGGLLTPCSPESCLYNFFIGLLAIPSCFAVAERVARLVCMREIVASVSRNCFAIYLLHMFVIQIGAVWWRSLPPGWQVPFGVFWVLTIPLAIILPMVSMKLLKKYLVH